MDKQFSDYAGAIVSKDKSRLEQITAMTVTIGGCIWFITDDCIKFALELQISFSQECVRPFVFFFLPMQHEVQQWGEKAPITPFQSSYPFEEVKEESEEDSSESSDSGSDDYSGSGSSDDYYETEDSSDDDDFDLIKRDYTLDHIVEDRRFLNTDIATHIQSIAGDEDESGFITIPQLNYGIPWKTMDEQDNQPLKKFIPQSDGQMFPFDGQVSRYLLEILHLNRFLICIFVYLQFCNCLSTPAIGLFKILLDIIVHK